MSLTLALSSDQLNTDLGEDGSLFDMLRFIIDLYFLIGALFFLLNQPNHVKRII